MFVPLSDCVELVALGVALLGIRCFFWSLFGFLGSFFSSFDGETLERICVNVRTAGAI
jgi:hypothetical protein